MMQNTNQSRRSETDSARSGDGARRLAAYAAAAGGAMIASTASTTHGAVIITNITTVGATTSFTIDLDVSGAGFNFAYTFSNIGLANAAYGRVSATNQLDNQQFIAAGGLVGSAVFLDANDAWNGGTQPFNFPSSGTTGYLGFRLTVGEGANLYGWIEYVNDGTSTTVSRWAYESQVNTGITTPTASAVPGGAGLAALAFGAAGLRVRRRRRN
ncbi:MAG: hypothetical protein ACO3EP_11715 [Phycisphaerales bacterium]